MPPIWGKIIKLIVLWKLLFASSQTTTVTRVGKAGGRLKVRVEIDRIGDMRLHISNLLQGKKVLGKTK